MSVQFAMMGMMVAGSVMSAISQKQQAEGKAASLRGQGAAYDLEKSQVELQGAQQERNIQQGVMKLLATNDAGLGAKGIVGEQGTSADVIREHNIGAANEDINTARMMSDTKAGMLSFKAEDARNAAGLAVAGGNAAFITTILAGLVKGASMGMAGGGGAEAAPPKGEGWVASPEAGWPGGD